MTRLLDILACPICRDSLRREGDELVCLQAAHRFPIVNGVPILLPGDGRSAVRHEGPLDMRKEYGPWVQRNVMQSLTSDQPVLDIGAGNMTLDDPCIIRMDVMLTPFADVVADAHALPFKDASLGYVFSYAVLEHLRQPFLAGQEMYRVLKRGGYVYADTCFVFAYHGFPHHYFNSSLHGIEQVFGGFTRLRSGVPPYQMPSYAIETVLSVYLTYFVPTNAEEEKFAQTVRRVLKYPLRAYDARFTQDIAYRISAGVYYQGCKQVAADDTLIPRPIMDVYARDPQLQTKYPRPNDLGDLNNLMVWAKCEGRRIYPEIAAYLDAVGTFNKYWDDRPLHRYWVESLPWSAPPPPPDASRVLAASPRAPRPLPLRAVAVLIRRGPAALARGIHAYWMRRQSQSTRY
jgi:uncharacterized protein YbaR (Trm112 family)/SAM-dependent methyltransferase